MFLSGSKKAPPDLLWDATKSSPDLTGRRRDALAPNHRRAASDGARTTAAVELTPLIDLTFPLPVGRWESNQSVCTSPRLPHRAAAQCPKSVARRLGDPSRRSRVHVRRRTPLSPTGASANHSEGLTSIDLSLFPAVCQCARAGREARCDHILR